jgi:hypothetical protein
VATNLPPPSPRKAKGKRVELAAAVERHAWTHVGEAEWTTLLYELAPVSENYLRKLLRESAIELDPIIAGVRQSSFEELETSLEHLLVEYEGGDASRRAKVRSLVITAKDHARWAARRPEHRERKEEMSLWMITWLENPGLFRDWLRLRKAARNP